MFKGRLNLFVLVVLSSIMTTSFQAQAEISSTSKGFAGTLGGSLEIGSLDSKGMELQDRTMTAISLEALLGYKLHSQWILGLDLNYRFQQQQTKAADSGSTNLAGKAWLVGLGAQYLANESWAFQGAIDFLGRYDFDKQTSDAQDGHLEKPLSLRLKAQYFIKPYWSIDASINYITWSTFHVGGEDLSENSKQWMVGTGITYHFGWTRESSASKAPAVEVAPTKTSTEKIMEVTAPMDEFVGIAETEKTEKGLRLKISGNVFQPYSSDVNPELSQNLKAIAAVFAKNNVNVKVHGYADTSGPLAENKKLSELRAQAGKKILVQGGVASTRITAVGKGTTNPIADNASPEGRAQNRRLEIETEE